MTATISDVARLAGVSTATVSRVLSGVGRARPTTSARVVAAADTLGYRASGIARALKLRATRTLGLLVTDIQNPYFPEVIRAVEDAALARDYAVLLCTGADDPEREAAYIELLIDRRVDGIVVATRGVSARYGGTLARASVPVVFVNCTAPGTGLPAILTDNRAGGRLAGEHLIELGHRRLGYLGGPSNDEATIERRDGVVDALRAAGLPDGALTEVGADGRVTGGEAALHKLLEGSPEVTGVFCFNDLVAIGALRAARAVGRRVPEDLSIVGFDDVDLASFVDPPLTTVVQDKTRMGTWAVETIAAALAERNAATGPGDDAVTARRQRGPVPAVRLATVLRVRGSSGPAPDRPVGAPDA
jgi:LacI family transcriptional regulator